MRILSTMILSFNQFSPSRIIATVEHELTFFEHSLILEQRNRTFTAVADIRCSEVVEISKSYPYPYLYYNWQHLQNLCQRPPYFYLITQSYFYGCRRHTMFWSGQNFKTPKNIICYKNRPYIPLWVVVVKDFWTAAWDMVRRALE